MSISGPASFKIIVVSIDQIGSLGWYCKRALSELGHQVELFDYRKTAYGSSTPSAQLTHWRKMRRLMLRICRINMIERMNIKLVNFVELLSPDLVLVQKGEIIFPETIKKIKDKSKAKVVVWHADSPFSALTSSNNIIHSLLEYDVCFAFDPYYIPEMIRAGAKRAEYLPFACDPGIHGKIELTEKDKITYGSDICFIGNYQGINSERTKTLQSLSDLNLRIWGNGWENIEDTNLGKCITNRPAYGEEMVKIYNASKIAINIHHSQSITGINMRTFEAPACGCFLLTDELPELVKFCKPNEEIVCYKDISDLRNKIEYYLDNPDERKKIARKGQKEIRERHIYIRRMEQLIKIAMKDEVP